MATKNRTVDPKANYYDAGGINTLAIIKARVTPEQFEGYLLGSALKYLNRANHKYSAAQTSTAMLKKPPFTHRRLSNR